MIRNAFSTCQECIIKGFILPGTLGFIQHEEMCDLMVDLCLQ